MKPIFKGLRLGLCLVILDRICSFIFMDTLEENAAILFSGVLFFLVTTKFLLSKNIPELLLCGFCGLFTMFATEFAVSSFSPFIMGYDGLMAYVGGFFGSMASIVVSIILTIRGFSFRNTQDLEDKEMDENFVRQNDMQDNISSKRPELPPVSKEIKYKLLIYSILTAMGFSYLVMPENVGIGVVIFTLLQFMLMWFVAPNKKRLILFIPLFIMSLNYFISASDVWRTSNFIISIILYACMFMDISFRRDTFSHFSMALEHILQPLCSLALPFKWVLELNSKNAPIIKRVIIALVIAIPCSLILTIILSSADMIFSMKVENLFYDILDILSLRSIYIIICGIIAGLYLFGTLFHAHTKEKYEYIAETPKKGDFIIISILMATILFVYTAFVIIQFKYLFSGATLPEGLIYSEYARKGFFELLALTTVNIAIILTIIRFTKGYEGKMLTFVKILCHYLCAVTVVLLVSSYYRMMLYVGIHGLTRLRLFVLGFLIFEAIGLLITFIYIAKPEFNIALIYVVISLCYYSLLNIVPTDNIIAKNQVDLYLTGKSDNIDYVLSLSADSVPALEYLIENTQDAELKEKVSISLFNKYYSDIPMRWQRYNYSLEKADKIFQYQKFAE